MATPKPPGIGKRIVFTLLPVALVYCLVEAAGFLWLRGLTGEMGRTVRDYLAALENTKRTTP